MLQRGRFSLLPGICIGVLRHLMSMSTLKCVCNTVYEQIISLLKSLLKELLLCLARTIIVS